VLFLSGEGVDFISNIVTAIFQPNQLSTTVDIPIVCDTVSENDEVFDINLIGNPSVILGTQSSAVGVIVDSTGMYNSIV